MTPDLKDRIVEFLVNGQLLFGLVTTQAIDKLQVTDSNGRNRRVHSRTVLIVHPGKVTLSDFGSVLQPLRDKIDSEEVDTELLWEVALAKAGALDPTFLAREYFGDEDACSRSAVLRAALGDPIRFRLKGVELFSRSRDQVEQQVHQRQIEEQRDARWEAISGWLHGALAKSEMDSSREDFLKLLEEAEKFLLSRNAKAPAWLTEEEPEIWRRTPVLRDLTPREAAFQLLICAGRLPPDADPLLVIAGIDPAFSPAARIAASELSPYLPNASRTDFTHLNSYAIDDADTVEVDDALTLEKTSSGWQVGIHIADVASFIGACEPLLEEARFRVSSLYLPHRLLTMLPERLSCDLASLNVGQLRPVISTLVNVDDQGKMLGFQICRGELSVKQRLTYDKVEERLNQGSDSDLSWFSWFGGLQNRLREEQGALTFHTPEFKVKVNAPESITVTQLNTRSPARQLVAEMMILANSLAARYAQESAIHLVYRAQKPPKKELKIRQDYDPVGLIDVFRNLERSRYLLEPAPHAGLGLEAYAQVTSPLRRLVDMLCQLQLSAHLSQLPAVFTVDELGEIIRPLGEVERNFRAVERRAIRHYLLKHVEQHYRSHIFEAIVLGPADRGAQIETIQFALRGRLPTGSNRPQPGERLEVRVDRIDLKQGSLTFRSVQPG